MPVAEVVRPGHSAGIHCDNDVLAAFPQEDYRRLAPHLSEVMLERGTVLQQPGQTAGHAYFPHHGVILLVALLPDGSGVSTAMIGRESALGLLEVPSAADLFQRALVHVPMRASIIPRARLLDAAARSAAVLQVLRRQSAILLQQVQQTVLCNTFHTLQERVCRWLLHDRDGSADDTLALTQKHLSDVLGARRTSVNLVIGVLQAEGIIEVRRGRVLICDRDRLRQKSCCCYERVRSLSGGA